ncbi:MAG TPA: LysR family transcriptional regulator [Reyranella sp.]|nr:LysR family transcriptional regulator [Reyranella sp.]
MIDHSSEMAAFVRVVDSKGFSAAAAGLGLSPSAVSKLVTRLEARLGVRLLQRTTRALHLTAEGEVFYAAARRIVGEIETLEQQMAGQSGTPQGLLRVTTSLAFATHQLAPVLSEFLGRHPLVQLDLMPTDRVVDIVDEGIDVAIRIGRLADTSFMARKIGEDKRLICAAPAYLARHGTPLHPQDLARHVCIVSRERPYLNRWQFKVDGQMTEIEVAGRVAVGDGELQMQLALQGIGIVRLTRLTLAQAVREGALVPVLGDFSADEPVTIHAVYPHRRHLAAKVPAFVNFLIEKFTPPPWEI